MRFYNRISPYFLVSELVRHLNDHSLVVAYGTGSNWEPPYLYAELVNKTTDDTKGLRQDIFTVNIHGICERGEPINATRVDPGGSERAKTLRMVNTIEQAMAHPFIIGTKEITTYYINVLSVATDPSGLGHAIVQYDIHVPFKLTC